MILEYNGDRFCAEPRSEGNEYRNGKLLAQNGVLEPGYSVVWTDRPVYVTEVVDNEDGEGSKVITLVEPDLYKIGERKGEVKPCTVAGFDEYGKPEAVGDPSI